MRNLLYNNLYFVSSNPYGHALCRALYLQIGRDYLSNFFVSSC